MTVIGLRLDPLDTLFFRDGRPFDAATRAAGGLPSPQTLAGALRTALLAQEAFPFDALAGARRQGNSAEQDRDLLQRLGASEGILNLRFRGPWLALAAKDKVEPLLPVPINLARDAETKTWYRADPLEGRLPGWDDAHGLRPLWRKEGRNAKHPGGFLTLKGIEAFLQGNAPQDEEWLKPDELYGFDHRTGIKIDPQSLTAVEGQIYGISLLALRQKTMRDGEKDREICLYAEVLADSDRDIPSPLPLGGEGRYVRVEKLKEPICSWPSVGAGERTLWYLAAPAFVPHGLFLPGVATDKRIAVAAGAPLAFSGWDVARGGPKPTRFALPSGSVFFLNGDFAPPDHGSICTEAEDVAQGWGFVLRGTWNYAK